jgi:hypothetical protein
MRKAMKQERVHYWKNCEHTKNACVAIILKTSERESLERQDKIEFELFADNIDKQVTEL